MNLKAAELINFIFLHLGIVWTRPYPYPDESRSISRFVLRIRVRAHPYLTFIFNFSLSLYTCSCRRLHQCRTTSLPRPPLPPTFLPTGGLPPTPATTTDGRWHQRLLAARHCNGTTHPERRPPALPSRVPVPRRSDFVGYGDNSISPTIFQPWPSCSTSPAIPRQLRHSGRRTAETPWHSPRSDFVGHDGGSLAISYPSLIRLHEDERRECGSTRRRHHSTTEAPSGYLPSSLVLCQLCSVASRYY
jgi:hypothetical protein